MKGSSVGESTHRARVRARRAEGQQQHCVQSLDSVWTRCGCDHNALEHSVSKLRTIIVRQQMRMNEADNRGRVCGECTKENS